MSDNTTYNDHAIKMKELLNEKPALNFNRNFGIIAHVDAGKTTTTEQILVCAGLKSKGGAVHEGATVTDFREDEKQRGITIQSASVFANWQIGNQTYELNLIDTPGHIDFNVEVEKSLTVLDGAVLVIDGKEGVQTQTRTVFRQAAKHDISMLVFINKLDGLGADFDKSFKTLELKLSLRPIAIQMPIGKESDFWTIVDLITEKCYYWIKTDGKTHNRPQIIDIPAENKQEATERRNKMLEVLSEFDDIIAEKVMNEEYVSAEEIIPVLRKCIIERKVMGVLCGASYKNIGIEPLLNAIALYLPNPVEKCRLFKRPDAANITISHTNGAFIGLIFNVMNNTFGTFYFIWTYSGSLTPGQKLYNPATNKSFIVRRFGWMFADKKTDITLVQMGDIVVLSGIDGVKIGDTLLGETNAKDNFEVLKIVPPTPVISQVITPKDKKDADKLTSAIAEIAARDISLHFGTNPRTNEFVISGMGALHLEVITNQIQKDYKLPLLINSPSIAYVETITTQSTEYVYEHKKQSGGRGQYALIRFMLEPLPRGSGIQFEDKVVGGEITASFIKGVQSSFMEYCEYGSTLQPDAQLVDIKMVLLGGRMHSVDSDELSFKLATRYALPELQAKCHPILLEPIMLTTIEISGGQEYIGVVNALIGKVEGVIISTTEVGDTVTMVTDIPSRTSQNIASELRNISKGNASVFQEYSGMAILPDAAYKAMKKIA